MAKVNQFASISETFRNISFPMEMAQSPQKTPVISDKLMTYFNVYLLFIVCGMISLFGLLNNIVNMIIFKKLGLNDSMSIGLMALSVTDFLVSLFSSIRIAFFVWNFLSPGNRLNPLAIHSVTTGWWRDILFLCSAWFTTFLSIERCVCVVFPFKVKQIFTKLRSVVVIIVIYVINIGAHLPVLLSRSLEWRKTAVTVSNVTVFNERISVRYPKNWPQIQLYIDIANGAVLPVPSLTLVLISVIWMIYGLKASSRIRRSNAPVKETSDTNSKSESNLSIKERRLIKLVLFLAIILIICSIPRFIAIYAKQIFPDVTFISANRNLYKFFWSLTNIFSALNASVNIFVYLKININYQQKFREIFCAKTDK